MKTHKFDPVVMARALEESHGLVSFAAKRMGCEQMTVRNYMKKFKVCRSAVDQARSSMKDVAEASLVKQIMAGEAWAICFYLKTQAKDRGYVEKQEIAHSGSAGVAIMLPDNGRTVLKGATVRRARIAGGKDKPESVAGTPDKEPSVANP